MKHTIEEIRQMQEGQTFDCKSILIEPKRLATTIVAMANADGGTIAVGISDKTRRGEGVDRMCRELRALGVRELQYNLVAFIMKATVYANVLEEKQETVQADYPETARKLPKNYPETTQIDQKSDQKSDRKQTAQGITGHNKGVTGHNKGITGHNKGITGHSKGITGHHKGITEHNKILSLIAQNPKISISALAKQCEVSEKAMRIMLERLKAENVIKRVGPSFGGHWEIIVSTSKETE